MNGTTRVVVVGLALAVLPVAGCKKSEAPPPPEPTAVTQQQKELNPAPTVPVEPPKAPEPGTPAPTPTPAPTEPAWTTAAVEKKVEGMPITVKDVRAAKNEGFDRTVFEFQGDELPGYQVEYADELSSCGSGEPIKLEGAARLVVRLQPAQAHNDEGQVTVAKVDRKLNLPVVVQLKQACDFEGVNIWGFGVKAKNPFRVMELSGPTRLVVDVKH